MIYGNRTLPGIGRQLHYHPSAFVLRPYCRVIDRRRRISFADRKKSAHFDEPTRFRGGSRNLNSGV